MAVGGTPCTNRSRSLPCTLTACLRQTTADHGWAKGKGNVQPSSPDRFSLEQRDNASRPSACVRIQAQNGNLIPPSAQSQQRRSTSNDRYRSDRSANGSQFLASSKPAHRSASAPDGSRSVPRSAEGCSGRNSTLSYRQAPHSARLERQVPTHRRV